LNTGVLGYIGVFYLKEHSPEVWNIPPGTPCIWGKILETLNPRPYQVQSRFYIHALYICILYKVYNNNNNNNNNR